MGKRIIEIERTFEAGRKKGEEGTTFGLGFLLGVLGVGFFAMIVAMIVAAGK